MPPIEPRTQLHTDGSLKIAIEWIVACAGKEAWLRRTKEFHERVRSSGFFRQSTLERHHVEICIADALGKDEITLYSQYEMPHLDAFHFARNLYGLSCRLSDEGKRRLAGKVKQALQMDYGFAALRTELTALLMSLELPARVSPVDLENEDRFDYLLAMEGEEVELECKLLTHDFGSTFGTSEFRRLGAALERNEIDRLLSPGKAFRVWLEIDRDLPHEDGELASFAGYLARTINGEECSKPEFVVDLRFEDWPEGVEDPLRCHKEARFIKIAHSCHTFAFDRDRSSIVFAIKVSGVDPRKRLDVVRKHLKEAADQFSGKRPSVLFLEVEGPIVDFSKIQMVSKYYEFALSQVFLRRPSVQLVLLGFAGPPFSSGSSWPIRNPKRKRRNQPFLVRQLEKKSRPKWSSELPGHEFRVDWWARKYGWEEYKSTEAAREEVLRGFGPRSR